MELQLAALSTYAIEANGVNMVLTGNRALRESLNRDVPPVLDSLESAVRDMQTFESLLHAGNLSFYHRARQESAQAETRNSYSRTRNSYC